MNRSLLHHIIEGAKSREGDADILMVPYNFAMRMGGSGGGVSQKFQNDDDF
jgi:hypothetical protein